MFYFYKTYTIYEEDIQYHYDRNYMAQMINVHRDNDIYCFLSFLPYGRLFPD